MIAWFFGHRDHIDAVDVGRAGAGRAAGGAGVDERRRIVAADVDDDVEQARIDAELDMLAGDIGGGAVDPGRAAMLDDRRDHRDIAALVAAR